MKNLILKLSNNSEFFNEKQFVFQQKRPMLAAAARQKPSNKPSAKRSPSTLVSKTQEKAAKAARERYLKNPDSFRQFASISQKVTKNLARLGIKPVKMKQRGPDGGTFEVTDTARTQELEQRAIDQIAKAFNKNDRAAMIFFEACVDLYVYKTIVDNRAKRIQIYRKLANKLARISPRTIAMLPNLKSALKPQPTVVAGGKARRRPR